MKQGYINKVISSVSINLEPTLSIYCFIMKWYGVLSVAFNIPEETISVINFKGTLILRPKSVHWLFSEEKI